MEEGGHWTVVQPRSVREEEEIASKGRDSPPRRMQSLSEKIGPPIRLQPHNRGIRVPIHLGSHGNEIPQVGGVLFLPPVGSQEEIPSPEVGGLGLVNEQDWPRVSERVAKATYERAGSSWSTVVRKPPPIVVQQVPPSGGRDREGGTGVADGKSRGSKKKSRQSVAPKDSRQPLVLEFGSMFEALKEQKQSGRMVLGGGVQPPRTGSTVTPKLESQGPRNTLDSSAPSMRRGKERETPKKKKASTLRKVIVKEKEEKRVHREACSHGDSVDSLRAGSADLEMKAAPMPSIHSRRFREYCSHLQTEDINECVQELLCDLVRFQDRQYHRDPVKAKARRRYVCGLREVWKHLQLRRLKCIIIAPNLDRIQSTGGIDDMVKGVISLCEEQNVPTVYALSRRRLGYVMRKSHKVGCVGIFSYDGAEVHYKRLLELVSEAKDQYELRGGEPRVSEVPTDSKENPPSDGESMGDPLADTPWRIFLPPSAPESDKGVDSVACDEEGFKLNILAPEFVPRTSFSCLHT